ncbi:hypothetical protein EHF33_13755 [Deinococcus psychrotolerans]|uniref:Uncharacterized protein n=1 Tax=Deinococcus psychrotolerans TaxID=2489213 RepID=A0A3G8YF81_9DEIO|nr:hypothetical protein [Deinococcus psychrotolerans]AZI43989.1 hypothetical protein EHF33_13755 [Deinococcus psychrotolerans]
MKLFVWILALVKSFSARHPLPKVMTEPLDSPLQCLALARLKYGAAVDEFSALYTLYANGELTPGQYWQAKKVLLEREVTRQTLHS